jgi:hypothetical protein
VTPEPPQRMAQKHLKGPMWGPETVLVTTKGDAETQLTAVYDVRLTGLLKLGADSFTRHANEGTAHAFQRIEVLSEDQALHPAKLRSSSCDRGLARRLVPYRAGC